METPPTQGEGLLPAPPTPLPSHPSPPCHPTHTSQPRPLMPRPHPPALSPAPSRSGTAPSSPLPWGVGAGESLAGAVAAGAEVPAAAQPPRRGPHQLRESVCHPCPRAFRPALGPPTPPPPHPTCPPCPPGCNGGRWHCWRSAPSRSRSVGPQRTSAPERPRSPRCPLAAGPRSSPAAGLAGERGPPGSWPPAPRPAAPVPRSTPVQVCHEPQRVPGDSPHGRDAGGERGTTQGLGTTKGVSPGDDWGTSEDRHGGCCKGPQGTSLALGVLVWGDRGTLRAIMGPGGPHGCPQGTSPALGMCWVWQCRWHVLPQGPHAGQVFCFISLLTNYRVAPMGCLPHPWAWSGRWMGHPRGWGGNR